MPIRKKINPAVQIAKTVNALTKAGVSGCLIMEDRGDTRAHIFGMKNKAFAAIQTALLNVPILKAAAQFATGPKMTVLSPDGETPMITTGYVDTGEEKMEINEERDVHTQDDGTSVLPAED